MEEIIVYHITDKWYPEYIQNSWIWTNKIPNPKWARAKDLSRHFPKRQRYISAYKKALHITDQKKYKSKVQWVTISNSLGWLQLNWKKKTENIKCGQGCGLRPSSTNYLPLQELYWSPFIYCGKMTDRINSYCGGWGGTCLAQSQRWQSMVIWFHCFWMCGEAELWDGGTQGLTAEMNDGQEAKKGRN